MKKVPGLNIGIDLGTSTVTAFAEGKGIVVSEATAISYDSFSGDIIAIGNSAMAMTEKAPDSIVPVRPIKSGVISDFSATVEILKAVMEKVCRNQIFRPNVVVNAPSCVTSPDRKAIVEACCAGGAGKVTVLSEPVLSALGIGLSIEHPHGVMVIDLGAGTTDIAVITMGTVAYATSLKIAGDDMDESILQYVRREKEIDIGLLSAKKIKHTVGCAFRRSEEIEMSVTGKDHVSGMPKMFSISSNEVYEALKDHIKAILNGIQDVLEQTPPELYSDICNEGITLTGGLSKLPGLDKVLSKNLGINVSKAADPEHSAAKGAGFVLKNMKALEDHGYSFRAKEYAE